MLDSVRSYLATGGFVMPALLVVGMVLWTALGLRLSLLRRGFRGDLISRMNRAFLSPESEGAEPRGLVDAVMWHGERAVRRHGAACRELLDELVLQAERDLSRFRDGIRSLCGVAPLLGLLGTVSGMIETFASLTGMELFARSGGVAGGVSEALVSTQMGLFVAIPGVIVGRLLDRKEDALRIEIHRAREQLAQVAGHELLEAT